MTWPSLLPRHRPPFDININHDWFSCFIHSKPEYWIYSNNWKRVWTNNSMEEHVCHFIFQKICKLDIYVWRSVSNPSHVILFIANLSSSTLCLQIYIFSELVYAFSVVRNQRKTMTNRRQIEATTKPITFPMCKMFYSCFYLLVFVILFPLLLYDN